MDLEQSLGLSKRFVDCADYLAQILWISLTAGPAD